MSHQVTLSITTVPDIETLRLIHRFDELSDEGVLNAAMHLHHQKTGNKILPLYQQQIVSIAVVKRMSSGEITSEVLGKGIASEVELLNEFAELMKGVTDVVSWDMNNVEQPLLSCRLLKHGIVSADLYNAVMLSLRNCLFSPNEAGMNPINTRQNSTDDDLIGLSRSLGLPDIIALTDQEITDSYLNNDRQRIHFTTQSRAQNSYLIYLRYQLITAKITPAEYEAANAVLSEALIAADVAAP